MFALVYFPTLRNHSVLGLGELSSAVAEGDQVYLNVPGAGAGTGSVSPGAGGGGHFAQNHSRLPIQVLEIGTRHELHALRRAHQTVNNSSAANAATKVNFPANGEAAAAGVTTRQRGAKRPHSTTTTSDEHGQTKSDPTLTSSSSSVAHDPTTTTTSPTSAQTTHHLFGALTSLPGLDDLGLGCACTHPTEDFSEMQRLRSEVNQLRADLDNIMTALGMRIKLSPAAVHILEDECLTPDDIDYSYVSKTEVVVTARKSRSVTAFARQMARKLFVSGPDKTARMRNKIDKQKVEWLRRVCCAYYPTTEWSQQCAQWAACQRAIDNYTVWFQNRTAVSSNPSVVSTFANGERDIWSQMGPNPDDSVGDSNGIKDEPLDGTDDPDSDSPAPTGCSNGAKSGAQNRAPNIPRRRGRRGRPCATSSDVSGGTLSEESNHSILVSTTEQAFNLTKSALPASQRLRPRTNASSLNSQLHGQFSSRNDDSGKNTRGGNPSHIDNISLGALGSLAGLGLAAANGTASPDGHNIPVTVTEHGELLIPPSAN